jgi:hypothetical protein
MISVSNNICCMVFFNSGLSFYICSVLRCNLIHYIVFLLHSKFFSYSNPISLNNARKLLLMSFKPSIIEKNEVATPNSHSRYVLMAMSLSL